MKHDDDHHHYKYKKGDLVLVPPMRYCITLASEDTSKFGEHLLDDDARNANTIPKVQNHWTGDGFKARVVQRHIVETPHGGRESYLLVRIWGQGRKHLVKSTGEKTKEAWIQERMVSPFRKTSDTEQHKP